MKMISKIRMRQNVEYQLKDKKGNIKKLFQLNWLGHFLMKLGLLSPFNKFFLFGSYQDKLQIENLVTNAGFAGVSSRLNGADGEAAFTYIGLGTGTTAANAADTTLETEIATGGGERASATASRETTTQTDDTARLVNTFSFTDTFAVTESGVLNAASNGTLLARQVFSAINVGNGDSLQVTWNFQVTTS